MILIFLSWTNGLVVVLVTHWFSSPKWSRSASEPPPPTVGQSAVRSEPLPAPQTWKNSLDKILFFFASPPLSLRTNPSVIPGMVPVVGRFIIRDKTSNRSGLHGRGESRMSPLPAHPSCVPLFPRSVVNEEQKQKTRDKRQWLYFIMRRCFNSWRSPFVWLPLVLRDSVRRCM